MKLWHGNWDSRQEHVNIVAEDSMPRNNNAYKMFCLVKCLVLFAYKWDLLLLI